MIRSSKYLPYFILLLPLIGGGCRPQSPEPRYVARVGDEYLSEETLNEWLKQQPELIKDSLVIRQQLIDQWIENTLLAQTAYAEKIDQIPEIQQRIKESTQAILIRALLDRFFEQQAEEPLESEIRTYYEQNKERMRLPEPYVHLRYLSHPSADSLKKARQLLQQATLAGKADSLWPALQKRFASDSTLTRLLASGHLPLSRLPRFLAPLWQRLERMKPGEISPVIKLGKTYHFVQLVQRIPAGTIPDLAWIKEDIRQILTIRKRKQMYRRYVQRLKHEALARDALEIR